MAAEDAARWCELLAAAEAVDATGEHYSVDDLLEELADPRLDVALDTMAAIGDDGRMVAYGLVRHGGQLGEVYRTHVEGCVHPDHRRTGLGREVLRRTVERAEQRYAEHPQPRRPGELHSRVYDTNAGATALLSGAGMRPVRWFYDMHRDLAEPPPGAAIPEGLRLVPYQPDRDDDVRLAHNEAFQDHWGSTPRDTTSWKQWFTGSRSFHPELSFLMLEDGGEIVGHLLGYVYEADCEANGVREAWVGQLGTRRPWRGRGVASALLTHALRVYAEAGHERAALGVDTANPTGALGLYQRAGFAPGARWTTFSRPL